MSKWLVASDLHGGNSAYRKLIGRAETLRPDLLIICGDWAGKRSIYAVDSGGGTRRYHEDGQWTPPLSAEEAQRFEKAVCNEGGYIIDVTNILNNATHNNASEILALEIEARCRRLTKWLDFGWKKLGQLGVPLVTIPGNDDDNELVNILDAHPWPTNVDGTSFDHEGVTFFGLGYSNPTPWGTGREISEEQIYQRLLSTTDGVKFTHAVAIIHVPPANTHLDLAQPVKKRRDGHIQLTGGPLVHVGSTSVRRFIEEKSPQLLCCGHCHDSAGVEWVKNTACVNPGSHYYSCMLSAYVLSVAGGTLKDAQPIKI